MITRSFLALRNLLIATWSVIVGYLLFALMESLILRGPVQPGVAAFILLALAVALFFLMRWAFPLTVSDLPAPAKTRAAVRFPNRPYEPLLGCPTCHSMMRLIGRDTRTSGVWAFYLWSCENDHSWVRQGRGASDASHAWKPCKPAEMMEKFFG